MYDNIKNCVSVVFKEGKLFDWCIVKGVSYTDNNEHGKLRNFNLQSRLDGRKFEVTVHEGDEQYCLWRFVSAYELTNYDIR